MVGRKSLAALATGVVSLALAACSGPEPKSEYVTAVAEVGDVRDSVPATGTLTTKGGAEIRAPRAGVISAVYAKEGDQVRAGQVLATLAAPARGPSREEAAANASASEASYREAEVSLRNARDRLERNRTLQAQGFVSPAAVRTAGAEVEQAQAAVDRLASERTAVRARARVIAAEGAGADVVAPLDGSVTFAAARVGQRVTPEDERALFQTGQDIRDMTLEILISEADLARVSMKSRVLFTVDAYPGISEEATLVSIGAAPIREGRFVSYRALARVNNYAEVLKPGMSASVQLVRADARSAVRIPIQATYFAPPDYMAPLPPGKLEDLKRESHGDMRAVRVGARGLEIRRMLMEGFRVVFVLEQGRPVRREIRVGAETDEFIEVTEGLRPGDVVIIKSARDARKAV
ncbi:efflux RND transporter periplasmic adaptor subunit [Caulobacter mirabilis]|uniref:Uncharacterized protein n=1 Tax=Caulobacter mirabilis TaxID=69666 RepID=A0A2D2AYK9_9CAUL|nr:efflux RND transporter periplasmic adaptor subunit [Caulobacter mirabilis]ATQ43106.1 hypothetical protein CSW64_12125 [Caulobacter mirabilis]